MPRQSITLTEPNDDWLAAMVESKEYSSKSELVNDLIRKERRRSMTDRELRLKLEASERSARSTVDRAELVKEVKATYGRNEQL